MVKVIPKPSEKGALDLREAAAGKRCRERCQRQSGNLGSAGKKSVLILEAAVESAAKRDLPDSIDVF